MGLCVCEFGHVCNSAFGIYVHMVYSMDGNRNSNRNPGSTCDSILALVKVILTSVVGSLPTGEFVDREGYLESLRSVFQLCCPDPCRF